MKPKFGALYLERGDRCIKLAIISRDLCNPVIAMGQGFQEFSSRFLLNKFVNAIKQSIGRSEFWRGRLFWIHQLQMIHIRIQILESEARIAF